jgi:hypothetical protein
MPRFRSGLSEHIDLPPNVYLSLGLDRSEVHAMSAHMPDAAQAALTAQSAAEEAMNASLAHSGAAQEAAQDAKQTAQDVKESTSDLIKALDVKVGAPTTEFQSWQQIPAWALGVASVGFAVLLALTEPQNQEAGWAFAIVGLVLAVLLSFRAEFTFGSVGDEGNGEPSAGDAESSGSGGGEPSEGAATEQPDSDA